MWTPAGNDQCVDRLHRISQNDCVIAELLVNSGSLDERVLKKCFEKQQVIDEVMG